MATVPTPATQVAGLAVPAATINSQGNLATYLAGRTESGGARKGLATLAQNVAQSIPNNTDTAVLLDSENIDYDNGHSTVTNTSRYTAGTSGWYLVTAHITYASNATGVRHARIRANGTTTKGVTIVGAVNGDFTAVPVTALIFLNATDYIELIALQTSGGALNITNNWVGSSMFVQWVSV